MAMFLAFWFVNWCWPFVVLIWLRYDLEIGRIITIETQLMRIRKCKL